MKKETVGRKCPSAKKRKPGERRKTVREHIGAFARNAENIMWIIVNKEDKKL